MDNNLEDPSSDENSALHNLIRGLTRLPATLKTFSLSDTKHHPSKTNRFVNEDSYNLLSKNHPVRKLMASFFLCDAHVDHHPQPSQLEAEPMSNDSYKRRMDNLVLDSFLKNTGGYLDDSGSSSDCSGLDDESDEEGRPNQQIHQGKNINIFAKKHQPKTTDRTASVKRSLCDPHPLNSNNLSKRLLHFHLTNKSDHQKPTTVIFNNPVPIDSGHDHHFPQSPNHQTVKPHVEHLETRQDSKPSHGRVKNGLLNRPRELKKNQAPGFSHLEGFRYHNKRLWCDLDDRRSNDTQSRKEEATLSLNMEYLQSSTFPTKNSILGSQYDLHARRAKPLTYTNTPPLKLNQRASPPGSIDDHHSDFDEFKSPFRNLVLGQDDLLRSN